MYDLRQFEKYRELGHLSEFKTDEILCVGCSFTRGYDANFTCDYPFQLRCLGPKSMPWITNAGLRGSGTWVHLFLHKHVFTLSPQVIIFQMMGASRVIQTTEQKNMYQDLLLHYSDPDFEVGPFLRYLYYSYLSDCLELSEDLIHQDMDRIVEFRSLYPCPFIFLMNDSGYPYYEYVQMAEREMRDRVLKHDDMLMITKFHKKRYQLTDRDHHPNILRAKETALLLLSHCTKFSII